MPIKWSADKDQKVSLPSHLKKLLVFKLTHPQLLLKILETSNITVDVKTISTNWSTDPGEEAPTPRAIQERIHKIRAMTKGKGTGSFKVTGTVGNQSSPSKVTKSRASPKKNMKKNNAAKETTTAEKRKRGGRGKKGAGNKNELSLLCTTGDTWNLATTTADIIISPLLQF
ncbi:MAG: hypothetical protein Q9197_006120 [Variospora fuerteventurae]